MDYIVIDRNGNRRGVFQSRAELEEELAEGEAESSNSAKDFLVVPCEDGKPAGITERGDEVLARRNMRLQPLALGTVAALAVSGASVSIQTVRLPKQSVGRTRKGSLAGHA